MKALLNARYDTDLCSIMEVFDDVPADEAGASVIKTRIGECKAAHQSSDQWIGKLKYLSIPRPFIRIVNLCEKILAASRTRL